ncbi:MAG TPA: hypothetical protein PKB13_01105 [Clostridia bacterium]|nr:hypothetical protein [Clostridia bacterium]
MPLTERDFDMASDRMTDETRKKLAAQPKVQIIINDDKPYWEGFINGHSLMIRTGEPVFVPVDIAALIGDNARIIKESERKLEQYRKGSGRKVAEM